MSTLRFPNRTAQLAVFHDGSPDYIDIGTGSTITGFVMFGAKATDDSWASGDMVGVYIEKDAANYKVWTASWNSTLSRLEAVTEEEAVGTIVDADAVSVYAVPTEFTFRSRTLAPVDLVQVNGVYVVETTTARVLGSSDNGKTICCTNGGATTVVCGEALPVGFHCLVVQEGAGAVSVARASTDTVNGGTSAIALAGQYKSAYVYQRTEGAWVVLA